MNEDDRPNPEDLLKVVQREETQRKKGKLKIFLGMAAGVGKTYAMLEAAQKLKSEGVYVVVGAIDTHGRQETAELLEGLQIIPEKWIKYKDTVFEELDLDAILKCKPQLVLVDELAHNNVPGSRHPKRWQDVMELLDHGIDVYTTLNVQHIESLKDLIEKIAGITIRETVPDLIIDQANSIELIDLSPEDLLQRLKEGKVYLGDQPAIAAQHFFQTDRLTALREIVLRYTAEKVEHDLQGMVSSVERPESWKVRERLLVAVSSSPHSQKLIRITRRLAFNLDAPWIAVHVDDGKTLDKDDEEVLAKNLALARDLGAEVITTSDPDIAQAIQRIARQKSVTQIIIGRPPGGWFMDLIGGYRLMDKLAKECSDIDLHVIRQTTLSKRIGKKWKFPNLLSNIASYFVVLCSVILLSLFNWYLLSFVSYRIVGFIFLLGILSLGLFVKKGPILFASILYAIIWIIFFMPYEDSAHSNLNEDITLLALYLITAIFSGILIDRARLNKDMLVKREKSIEVLYEIVRDLAIAPSLSEALYLVKEGLNSALEGTSELLLRDKNKESLMFDESIPIFKNEKEKAAANWVYLNGKEAGWSTTTLPFAQNFYIPLKGSNEIVGVLAFHSKDDKELNIEEKNFLYTVAQQLANYLERTFAEENARKYEHHKQVEKIYQSILNLISNLFEGPLLTIQDAVKDLKKTEETTETPKIASSVEQIDVSSGSLAHILENISAMINLSAGLTPIKRSKNDLKELIHNCYERVQKLNATYKWVLVVDQNIPLVLFDYSLIELLFYNLAFHAMEFSFPESIIEVEAKQSGGYVVVSVSGEGQSIPTDMLDTAFEQFYRMPGTLAGETQGLGLGLAIAKTIAEIHNGVLEIKGRDKGGMIFSLFLPLD